MNKKIRFVIKNDRVEMFCNPKVNAKNWLGIDAVVERLKPFATDIQYKNGCLVVHTSAPDTVRELLHSSLEEENLSVAVQDNRKEQDQ